MKDRDTSDKSARKAARQKAKSKGKDRVKKAGPAPVRALPAPDRPQDPALLDVSRIQWQHGDWADLAGMDADLMASHPERARLALIVAAAHAQLGDTARARVFADRALDWGCSRSVAAQVLISSAHNGLARVATALQDSAATGHFTAALRLVEPNGDLPLLARSRQIRETTRLGLLPEAADLLATDLAEVAPGPADHADRVAMLDMRLMELKHELSISLSRGQIHVGQIHVGQVHVGQDQAGTPQNLAQRSVAQLGQDLWVLERSGYKRGGYFVEFGATDGVLLSNTLLLEREFGWTGLLAEPNPDFFRDLQRNRQCKTTDTCIGARSGDRVTFILADEYGGIADYAALDHNHKHRTAFHASGKVMQVTTTALDDFLRQNGAPRDIDYLSIDTEGNEYDILKSFPFQDWRIRLLTVEHNFTETRESIHHLLKANGYARTEQQWDDWYELNPGPLDRMG